MGASEELARLLSDTLCEQDPSSRCSAYLGANTMTVTPVATKQRFIGGNQMKLCARELPLPPSHIVKTPQCFARCVATNDLVGKEVTATPSQRREPPACRFSICYFFPSFILLAYVTIRRISTRDPFCSGCCSALFALFRSSSVMG